LWVPKSSVWNGDVHGFALFTKLSQSILKFGMQAMCRRPVASSTSDENGAQTGASDGHSLATLRHSSACVRDGEVRLVGEYVEEGVHVAEEAAEHAVVDRPLYGDSLPVARREGEVERQQYVVRIPVRS
jgi:hypothetical protein